MKVEISIDCVDDTGRIPKGQIIVWDISASATGRDCSRDVRMRAVAKDIVTMLRKNYPKTR